MPEADYGICGLHDFAIERKGSLNELSANCMGKNRERFERELFRLRPYRFKRLLICEATCDEDVLAYSFHANISPAAVLGSLYAFQARFDLPFVYCKTAKDAARQVERWVHYWWRERVEEQCAMRKGSLVLELAVDNPASIAPCLNP